MNDCNPFTPDGKIKTIRCVKATHEDFAKLVNMGKKVKKEILELESVSAATQATLCDRVQRGESSQICGKSGKTVLEIYTEFVEKQSELDAYRNAYHVLMEEGVDELLASINVEPESYDYNFYELCLDF